MYIFIPSRTEQGLHYPSVRVPGYSMACINLVLVLRLAVTADLKSFLIIVCNMGSQPAMGDIAKTSVKLELEYYICIACK